MMQGFYWDTPSGWYNTMKSNANGLRYMTGGKGINRMYFPPPSKGQGGGYSMGYDPADYKDVGSYNQHGNTATRFGTQVELTASTAEYRNLGVSTMVDIILNHRSGGGSESNPNTGGSTWTDFSGQASGFAKWHYNQFHPSTSEWWDEGAFGGYPDVCHVTGPAAGQPYGDFLSWSGWLTNGSNAGFNGGWRFDYVKGYHAWMSKDFKNAAGGFGIGEYWDSQTDTLDWWANTADCSVFDFASYYTLKDICLNTGGGGYLPNVLDYGKSYAAKNQWRAVTFLGNHDTDDIYTDKMLGYAYALTYKGYPCIWWKDYFNYGLATVGGQWGNGIKQLVWCRESLAGGTNGIEVLKSNDGDCLIYGAYGFSSSAPGYIVVLNDSSSSWRGAWVQTGNGGLKNKTLKCYAWYSSKSGQNVQPGSKFCQSNGWVEPWAAPRGYAVYAPDGL